MTYRGFTAPRLCPRCGGASPPTRLGAFDACNDDAHLFTPAQFGQRVQARGDPDRRRKPTMSGGDLEQAVSVTTGELQLERPG
jgi:hypothetical protein